MPSRSASRPSSSTPSRSRPSVSSSTMAPCPSTRRDHSRLKRCRLAPMRVPPSQSCAARPHRSSASSGSRRESARVTLVSRVPNRKVETRRRRPSACKKCRKSREYSLIEPEMSTSATSGGWRNIGALRTRSIEPSRIMRRNEARGSKRAPRAATACRRVRTKSSDIASFAIWRSAAAISAALIWAKSLLARISAVDIV